MQQACRTDLSVLLQFAKFSRGFKISDFDQFVEESIGLENLEFFGRLAYPNQWQIRLNNREVRERLIRTGRTRIKNRSCWMYPLNKREIRGFVHWLPNSVTNAQLTVYLKFYGEVLFIESQKVIMKDQTVESDARYYGLLLKEDMYKEDLPHFLRINGFLSLVIIRGRQTACFYCKEVGHRRVQCPKLKAKLIKSSGDSNAAATQLRTRGRRHVRLKTEMRDDSGVNDVSSSNDIVNSESEIPPDEKTIEPPLLSVLENQGRIIEVQEEATSSSVKRFLNIDNLAKRKSVSNSGNSATPFFKTQTKNIVKSIQHIQRRTSDDLKRMFKNYEMEVVQAFTRAKPTTHTGYEKQSIVSQATNNYINLEHDIYVEDKEKVTAEICAQEETSAPPMAHLNIIENIKKICTSMHVESTELVEGDLVSVSDTKAVPLMLEQTKQNVEEILENTLKRLTESAKRIEAAEILSKDSAADAGPEKIRLSLLEQAKQLTTEYVGNTFKRLKDVDRISLQLVDDLAEKDTKLTEDDIQFAHKMLEKSRKIAGEALESTFGNLENEIANESSPNEMAIESSVERKLADVDIQFSHKMLEQSKEIFGGALESTYRKLENEIANEMTTKSSAEKRLPLKITETSNKCVASEQLEENVIDTGRHFEKEVVEAANTDNGQEEMTAVIENITLKLQVFKATQKAIDKLHTNIRNSFVSILEKDNTELLPETETILKQAESKTNQVVEELRQGLETDIEDIFASFKISDL